MKNLTASNLAMFKEVKASLKKLKIISKYYTLFIFGSHLTEF